MFHFSRYIVIFRGLVVLLSDILGSAEFYSQIFWGYESNPSAEPPRQKIWGVPPWDEDIALYVIRAYSRKKGMGPYVPEKGTKLCGEGTKFCGEGTRRDKMH